MSKLPRVKSRRKRLRKIKIVKSEELSEYTPAFLGRVKDAWKNKRTRVYWEWILTPNKRGVSVRLKGSRHVKEVFPRKTIEAIE